MLVARADEQAKFGCVEIVGGGIDAAQAEFAGGCVGERSRPGRLARVRRAGGRDGAFDAEVFEGLLKHPVDVVDRAEDVECDGTDERRLRTPVRVEVVVGSSNEIVEEFAERDAAVVIDARTERADFAAKAEMNGAEAVVEDIGRRPDLDGFDDGPAGAFRRSDADELGGIGRGDAFEGIAEDRNPEGTIEHGLSLSGRARGQGVTRGAVAMDTPGVIWRDGSAFSRRDEPVLESGTRALGNGAYDEAERIARQVVIEWESIGAHGAAAGGREFPIVRAFRA